MRGGFVELESIRFVVDDEVFILHSLDKYLSSLGFSVRTFNRADEVLVALEESVPDAIIATGRSDYPNQVNNVLCYPFIFRGGAARANDGATPDGVRSRER